LFFFFLDVYKFDPDFEANEERYKSLRTEILGSDNEDESGSEADGDDEDDDDVDDDGEEKGKHYISVFILYTININLFTYSLIYFL